MAPNQGVHRERRSPPANTSSLSPARRKEIAGIHKSIHILHLTYNPWERHVTEPLSGFLVRLAVYNSARAWGPWSPMTLGSNPSFHLIPPVWHEQDTATLRASASLFFKMEIIHSSSFHYEDRMREQKQSIGHTGSPQEQGWYDYYLQDQW